MHLKDRFLATWNASRGYRALLIGGVLVLSTLITGFVGWGIAGETGFFHRLYLTFLAFGGDPVYALGLPPDNISPSGTLAWTRFLGLATTLIAVFTILSAVLSKSLGRLRAKWRTGHAVLVGPSIFGLERLQRIAPNKAVTILGTNDFTHQSGSRQLNIQVNLDDSASVLRLMGEPSVIMFGARETVRNVARARALLPERPGARNTFLRVEDIALVRDLAQLAPELDNVQPVSSSETVAEAVIFAISAPEMADLRGQLGVHAVLIGLGATNLAIAEQLAVTCFHPRHRGMDRLRLTVLDSNVSAARARLRGQSPGLEKVATVLFRQMDGLDCRRPNCLDKLRAIERLQPVTVILVATGDDARNAAIGMRLRQIQLECLTFKAPILLRNHVRTGHAPGPIKDISGGLYDFGGDQHDPWHDPKLEKFEDELAVQMHDRWYDQALEEWKNKERASRPKRWDELSSADMRSSRLAARAAPHVLRSAGLLADPGAVEANMHVAAGSVQILRARMDQLKRLEHERWMAEKRLDGYVQTAPNGPRDDERRLHPALVPWEELSEADQDKDIANIDLLIEHCRDRQSIKQSAWRWRWRVGVMGPLSVTLDAANEIEAAFADYLSKWDQTDPSWPVSLQATSLEILTPDAPGFDRVAAAAIARAWTRVTGRACRLTAMRAARPELLEDMATNQLLQFEQDENPVIARARMLSAFAKQSQAMESAVGQYVSSVDLRPSRVSDADLRERTKDGDYPLFYASTEHVSFRIDELSDLLVWGASTSSGVQSRAVAHARVSRQKPTLQIEIPEMC